MSSNVNLCTILLSETVFEHSVNLVQQLPGHLLVESVLLCDFLMQVDVEFVSHFFVHCFPIFKEKKRFEEIDEMKNEADM